MELVGEINYAIKLNIQLLQEPLIIAIDDLQTYEQDEKVKKAFEKALETWKNLNTKFGGALYVIPHFMNKMMLGDHPIDWLYRYWKSAYSKECIKYENLIHELL